MCTHDNHNMLRCKWLACATLVGQQLVCVYAGNNTLEHEDQPRFSAKDGPLYTAYGVGGQKPLAIITALGDHEH